MVRLRRFARGKARKKRRVKRRVGKIMERGQAETRRSVTASTSVPNPLATSPISMATPRRQTRMQVAVRTMQVVETEMVQALAGPHPKISKSSP